MTLKEFIFDDIRDNRYFRSELEALAFGFIRDDDLDFFPSLNTYPKLIKERNIDTSDNDLIDNFNNLLNKHCYFLRKNSFLRTYLEKHISFDMAVNIAIRVEYYSYDNEVFLLSNESKKLYKTRKIENPRFAKLLLDIARLVRRTYEVVARSYYEEYLRYHYNKDEFKQGA
ncbi:hypothetical protein DMB95_08835 [Campylobacter sp. MIT 12-8780]|uniref:hypothetical protein n=1 Tax=unclassified Campylobacter TaxID=2593542 RepID=UPI00115EA41B|nr:MULTISPECIES: hypothetical protein [unclassified Campylobacter]NDJ27942.1 hypothetical protein [Campylobacter sp. MIT 19-121]TQR40126.1 hypothetical protein DMB95_08835 [Campylobacter sp. MIT 12-8780]